MAIALVLLLSTSILGFQSNNCDSQTIAKLNGYRLSSTSQFKNKGSDGKDPGVDVDKLIEALCGTGTPPPPPPPTDNIPPLVSLQVTRDNKNNVTATATVIDNVGVVRVEFYLDGILKSTDTASPYSIVVKLTGRPGSQQQLFARAYDAAGNAGISNTIQLIR